MCHNSIFEAIFYVDIEREERTFNSEHFFLQLSVVLNFQDLCYIYIRTYGVYIIRGLISFKPENLLAKFSLISTQ